MEIINNNSVTFSIFLVATLILLFIQQQNRKKDNKKRTLKRPRRHQMLLLVDQDKFLIDMYGKKFREAGLEVVPAYSCQEALDKLNSGLSPSIIVTDILMPESEIDGFEFIQRIKEEKLAPFATIIIHSNLGQPEEIHKGSELGVDGFIVKGTAYPNEVVTKVISIAQIKEQKGALAV